MQDQNYDLIIIGTGFAGAFFLTEYLRLASEKVRVLVLERGEKTPHQEQIKNPLALHRLGSKLFRTAGDSNKSWVTTPAFGGGSNCWWACTPRFHPNDFRLKSLYEIAEDWPISYGDLEPFYQQAEEIMQVAGTDFKELPRKKAFPQSGHNFNQVDQILKQAYPDQFTIQPTARARIATKNRPRCCATGVCGTCPIDAKFTIQNELTSIYQDSRVKLLTNAEVLNFDTQTNQINKVNYRIKEKTFSAKGELIILAANAIFNPFLLAKSEINSPALGKFLGEQLSISLCYDLNGVDNFQGSTSITGHGYMLYDGPHRREYAGGLLEIFNIPNLRPESGKWQQRLECKLILEELLSEENYIDSQGESPLLRFKSFSDYAKKGITEGVKKLEKLLEVLPIEKKVWEKINPTEGHVIGTTKMGKTIQDSVVDQNLLHHQIKNLIILGSSVFPTCSPANPTLTIAALALKAANSLFK